MSQVEEEARRVFISYSQESPEHMALVLQLCNQLREDGVDARCDQYETSPAAGWLKWMEKEIASSDFVLIVSTERYKQRLAGNEKPGVGQGVIWEANLIYQHIYNNSTLNSKFIPVLLPGSDHE